MSITRLPRELGIIIRCNGTQIDDHPENHKRCPEKFQTANVYAGVNRTVAATQGWGRGLRKGRKRNDHCPKCMPIERELFAKQKADREVEKKRRDELKKAKLSAAPLPKKPRKSRATSSPTTTPSVDSAPAPA